MAQEQQNEQAKAYGRVVVKAWSDETFKQRLIAEPAAVLKEYGIDVPEGAMVQVHEADGATTHFVLPARPAELTDEQLAAVAGGSYGCYGPGLGNTGNGNLGSGNSGSGNIGFFN